ncbi:MAG: leucine-rich repeat domain-containing protein [Spirochaetaceae bacterium]|jgi:hypothetical protein|nr:leucine-rich repeat domain-containing protein [Spirochaetaceae bacterium]
MAMKNIGVLMVCMTVCGAVLFAQTDWEADFETKAEGDGVMITGYKGKGGDVIIPGIIGGKAVVSIGDKAFANNGLASVRIPASVTSIGSSAFYACYSLKSAMLPEGVATIGDQAFAFCTSLQSIMLPESVTSIGEETFIGCSGLESITIPAANQQYKEIDGVLFTKDGTTLLVCPAGNERTDYTIPEGVTAIGPSAFYYCSKLTTVNIPEGVTGIDRSAFIGCSKLAPVTLPASVTSVGSGAFSGLKPEDNPDIVLRFGYAPFR